MFSVMRRKSPFTTSSARRGSRGVCPAAMVAPLVECLEDSQGALAVLQAVFTTVSQMETRLASLSSSLDLVILLQAVRRLGEAVRVFIAFSVGLAVLVDLLPASALLRNPQCKTCRQWSLHLPALWRRFMQGAPRNSPCNAKCPTALRTKKCLRCAWSLASRKVPKFALRKRVAFLRGSLRMAQWRIWSLFLTRSLILAL
mmetsp:Transcript_60087/g.69609  ORF Transcript_60087/g.69609 Transcript_60087/m.69609 type:complete len:200 (-) Transcript_60087:323-922(-)